MLKVMILNSDSQYNDCDNNHAKYHIFIIMLTVVIQSARAPKDNTMAEKFLVVKHSSLFCTNATKKFYRIVPEH